MYHPIRLTLNKKLQIKRKTYPFGFYETPFDFYETGITSSNNFLDFSNQIDIAA